MLKGNLLTNSLQYLVIDVRGVGYQVFTSAYTFAMLPQTGEVTLHIYTAVREDAITLYGFSSNDERELYTILISVSGVGPKVALGMLSIGPKKLITALREEDKAVLTSLPGVGKKTADRLILELSEKLEKFQGSDPALSIDEKQDSAPIEQEVISALVNLGYDQKRARKTVKHIDFEKTGSNIENVIREALKLIYDK